MRRFALVDPAAGQGACWFAALNRHFWKHHSVTGMRRYIPDHDWLTVYQLPPYAPDLNPVEGIWSLLRRTTTANRAFKTPADLITAIRHGLRRLHTDTTSSTAVSPAPDSSIHP